MKRWTAARVAATLVVAALATCTLTTSAGAATAPAPEPTTTAPTTSDVASVTTADAATLVGSIPVNHRYQCSLTAPNIAGDLVKPEFGHIRAFLQCFGVNNLRLFWYALFDDNASLDRAYRSYAGDPDPNRPYRDENAQCPGESGWGFGGAQDQGLLDCYYTGTDATGTDYGGETVVLVWKYDRTPILALAQTQIGDNNAAALKQWWENDAGPLEAPQRDKSFVDWNVKNVPAERTLLTHLPRRIRATCKVQRGTTAGSFETIRYLVTARASCTSGNVSVVYASMSPAITEAFMLKYHDIVGNGTDPCPDMGQWWVGSGENRRVMGEYACWGSPGFDGSTTAQIVWSHHALGIVAIAALPSGDADFHRMWDWWNGDVGPT
jgi:hypothetical protein